LGSRTAGLDSARPVGRDDAMDRITALEERVAHLLRATDELSEVVARQDREIERLTKQIRFLLEREAQRDDAVMGEVPVDRPPHY
jgi:SlyX protein